MLLIIIKLYRLVFKRFVRSACLFKTSCSLHVEAEYIANGNRAGWRALLRRYQDCRPGYSFVLIDKEPFLVTSSGHAYPKNELSSTLKSELEKTLDN